MLKTLRNLPQFNALEKAIKENLTINNIYVEHFAQDKYRDVKDDDGRQVINHMSNYEIEQNAIESLLDDNSDWFDEFVHEELRSEVTELMRVLIRELRKWYSGRVL